MVDVAIAIAIAAGAFIGWRRGFVAPLFAQVGAVLALAVLYAGPLEGVVPSGALGLGAGVLAFTIGGTVLGTIGSSVAKIVARFAVARRIDHAAGVPLGALVTAVMVYVALVGTLTVDAWLSPLHGKSAIGVADVAAVQALAKTNPALGAFAEPAMLQTLADQAATAPIASAQLAQYDAALGYYEETVRPQLFASRIAPLLLAVGEHLPIIGRHVDFPTK